MTYKYTCNDCDEELTHTTPEEAVLAYLEETDTSAWPVSLEVYKYERDKIPNVECEHLQARVLCTLLEDLDEDYGGPDTETKPTDEMKSLAKTYVEGILRLYRVWRHSLVETTEVNTAQFIREHKYTGLDAEEDEDIRLALERLQKEEQSNG